MFSKGIKYYEEFYLQWHQQKDSSQNYQAEKANEYMVSLACGMLGIHGGH